MEHLVLASFRSIEHRRALVRSTNTGISAIVDPVGRIANRTNQWTKASLTGRIPLMQGRTVYAVLGDWIGWVCVIITLVGIGRALHSSGRLAKNRSAHRDGSRIMSLRRSKSDAGGTTHNS
jgi:apolipoprotein N-acyltransferase